MNEIRAGPICVICGRHIEYAERLRGLEAERLRPVPPPPTDDEIRYKNSRVYRRREIHRSKGQINKASTGSPHLGTTSDAQPDTPMIEATDGPSKPKRRKPKSVPSSDPEEE